MLESGDKRGIAASSHALDLALLLGWTMSLNLLGLGALEFFRHTEADRTLIAWEMADGGSWIVPHLLGAPILTKPPLYYWMLAGTIELLGNASEFVARLPSVFVSVLFVLSQYGFVFAATKNRKFALLSSLFLSTTALFLGLAAVAEIDMAFGFFCALALYGLYFLFHSKASYLWAFFSYTALGLSFLTKGPPCVFFFVATGVVYGVLTRKRAKSSPAFAGKVTLAHLLGVLVFASILLLYFSPLADSVGFDTLVEEFRVEIWERFVGYARIQRGPLFYIWALIGGGAPWSIVFVVGAFDYLKNRKREYGLSFCQGPNRNLFIYSIVVVVSATLMLSLSSGKSSRYLFPVFPFAVNLFSFGAFFARGRKSEIHLYFFGKVVSSIAFVSLLVAPLVIGLVWPSVSSVTVAFASLSGSVVAILLFLSCSRKNALCALSAVLLGAFVVRIGEFYIYAPLRNARHSVRPVARVVDSLLLPAKPLYVVSMSERWVCYYLKRLGRESFRITEDEVDRRLEKSGELHLLLSIPDERALLGRLMDRISNTRVLRDFQLKKKRHLVLLELRASNP